MNGGGLSFDQAPPLGVPLRLMLMVPLFLLLTAAVGVVTADTWPYSRWSSAALALTHLLTLGVLGLAMIGALLQMLPVMLGAPIAAAGWIARSAQLGVGGGAVALSLGLGLGEPALLTIAMICLVAGLAPFLVGMANSLRRAASLPRVAWPMRQAWLALLLTVVAGLWLAGALSGLGTVSAALIAQHAAWGLAGWVLILVVGVAYQVVPMLQLTPAYPDRLSTWLTWAILAGLMLYTLAVWRVPGWSALAALPVCIAAAVFAATTLDLQRRRRRKLADATLDFWRLGMGSLLGCALLFPAHDWLGESAQVSLGLAFLLGFALSVVNGMLYKIVPFLAWFHLQAQTGARAGTIPNMKDFVPDAAARLQYRAHLAGLLLLLPAPFLPAWSAIPGLLCLAISAQRLWLNLLRARRMFVGRGGRL